MQCYHISVFTVLIVVTSGQQVRKTVNDYLNTCMDAVNHKTLPGPEGTLFSQCLPWKDRSCCTNNVTVGMHQSTAWLNFNWNHCGDKTLSPNCRKHFIQDLCFYECSPNVGPWFVKVSMKIRNERFMYVPLCQSECDNWWNDCKDDFTCKDNWGVGFNWTTGTNTCPVGTLPCRKFSEVFDRGATHFCEEIWDHSWKVVPDTESCMKIWFNEGNRNPNDEVARLYAEKLVNGYTTIFLAHQLMILTAFVALVRVG